ncbi:hypothetical protein BOX15_Mlig003031g1 [Macrostomum lignano]|uniref:Receptor ligand binding region domain-containing protein n=1 Tax=Macrostomum lignano TaxID=282301 RepID=A0A267E2X0_9PLAT|nr:hypothetical protein BOX15_Mlig003031g1 [Macrostomum lignano]
MLSIVLILSSVVGHGWAADASSCAARAVILSNSKQQPTLTGRNCSSSNSSWDASSRINAALSNIILQRWFGASCQAEVCQSTEQVAAAQRQRWTKSSVFTNLDSEYQLEFLLQYRRAMESFGSTSRLNQPVFATVPSRLDAPMSTAFESGSADAVFTPGPSVFDLAEAAYQLVTGLNWTYIAVVTSTSRGDQLLAGRLRQLASRGSRRLCLGLVLSATSENATAAAEQLKRHVYSDKRLARLAVLLAAPADTVSRLLQLVSGGGDARYADTERRFQWILAGGEAFRFVGQQLATPASSTVATSLLGSLLLRPGVVDFSPGDDLVVSQVLNSTLSWLSPEFPQCNWTELSSPCYDAALNYDYLLLSLLPLLSRTLEAWAANGTLLSALRNSTGSFSFSPSLLSSVPFYGIFTDANYTGYSFSRGLYHRARGFSAPAVKMFNVQEVAGAKRLVKLGELLVDSAGDEARRSVTWQLGGPAAAKFYGLNASSGIVQEVPSLKSECSGVCPNCLGTSSGIVEFSPGDYYIGVIAPVRYPGNDRFYCSDGTLRGAREGGYQFALAVKFILQAANHLATESSAPPAGFNSNLMDQQLLAALRALLASATSARAGQAPKFGYVIIDSCYLGAYTGRNLNLLLSGQLAAETSGFHYSKLLGFVGALSSTSSMAAAELLKQFGLPLVSYGSTSTVLNDTVEYPSFARTVVTDRVIVQSMVQLLRFLQADYIVVVFADTDYGRSLRDQLLSLAAEADICIGRTFAHTTEDSVSNANLLRMVANQRVRYVPFLGSLEDLTNFLDFAGAETAASGLTLLTTEAVGSAGSWLAGRADLCAGCLSVEIDAGQSAAFVEHQRSLLARPPSAAEKPWPPWLVSYFQSARGCYLATEFARTEPAAVGACGPASPGELPGLGFLDSRAPLAANAAAALLLGGLATVGTSA